ncbi:MAG: hypothetical protein QM601_11100, partial [Pseudoxanthomonas sp.]
MPSAIARSNPQCRFFRLLATLALALCGVAAHAETSPFIDPTKLEPVTLPSPVITRHHGIFNGQRLAYDAIVESFTTTALDGTITARLVSTSYVAVKPSSIARPVLFAFNGGPIAASTPLHFGLLGPQRLAVPDDLHADASTFKLVDNRYSPLDVADIVIFDPASTGYSRVADGVAPASQFSTRADSRQLAQLVQAWLQRHGRQGAQVYLLGESYGTLRAPEAATQLKQAGTAVAGIILLGQAANII